MTNDYEQFAVSQWTGSALVKVSSYGLVGAKPLPEPMQFYCECEFQEETLMKFG